MKTNMTAQRRARSIAAMLEREEQIAIAEMHARDLAEMDYLACYGY